MQVEIGKDRRNHRPLRTPFLRLEPLTLFYGARLEPFLDQADHASISDPMFHKLDQPTVLDFVEKGSDIKVQNPAHFSPHNPYPQRVQRIMLSAPRPESVAKAQKVLFPYLVEDCPGRVLDDLILQCRDSQRTLPPVGFRYPDSSRRLCLICSTMDSSMQVGQPSLQVSSIFFPRHSIHSRRRLFLQAVITRPKQVNANVVQQSRELQLPILPGYFPHTLQPAWPAFPALSPAQVRLPRVLLGLRPFLHNLRWRCAAFVRLLRRYYAAVRLPAVVHGGLTAHRVLPPARHTAWRATTGPPGSRAWSFSACLGSQTPWGRCVLALACAAVLPSGFLTPWAPRNKDFEVQCPAYRYPYPTLQVQPYSCTRMARGQSGSLDLLCTALSSATPSRFYPGANQKLLPCRLPAALRCRLHPVSFQNRSDRAAGKLVAQIGQRTLDSSIAPIPVLLCHAHNQCLYLLGGTWPTR